MVIGVLRLLVEAPEAQSLKDKRTVIRSLRDRIEARFKVSVAEVGRLDDLQQGELAVAVVSNDRRHADEVLARIASFAEGASGDGYVSDITTELMSLG